MASFSLARGKQKHFIKKYLKPAAGSHPAVDRCPGRDTKPAEVDAEMFWEAAEVIAFPEVQGEVRAAFLKARDPVWGLGRSCGLGYFSSCFTLLIGERQVLGLRDGFSDLKSQTSPLEECDTIPRGIKLFLFRFFWPS